MGLRDIGATLPPGFRFYPNDEELVCHYLFKKIANEEALKGTLVDIDLHTCEPWQLPEVAKLNTTEWYFFSFRDRKYATGYRTNRATTSGYWKATGKDRVILDPITRETVGMRKTLVFYRNRAPNGVKTGWIMHEFRLESPHMPPKEDWVLCRVFHKSKAEENSNDNNHCQHMHEHHNTASTSSPHTCFTCQQPNNNINNTFSSNNPNLPPPPQHHQVDPIVVSLNNNNMNNVATTPTPNPTTTTNNKNNNLPTTLLNPNNNNNNNNSLLNLINKEGNTGISWSDFMNTSMMKNDDDYGFMWDMDLDDNKLGEGSAGLNVPPNCLPQLEFADQLGFGQDGFSGGCVNF